MPNERTIIAMILDNGYNWQMSDSIDILLGEIDPFDIEILKVDTDGNPIEGVEISLYEEFSDTYITGMTDEYGTLTFNVSEIATWSRYIIQEISVPSGYLLNIIPFEFDVSIGFEGDWWWIYNTYAGTYSGYEGRFNDSKIIYFGTEEEVHKISITIANEEETPCSLEILKVDTNGNPIPGVVFSVEMYDGYEVSYRTGMTDENGRLVFNILQDYDGDIDCEICELEAPKEYVLNSTPMRNSHRDV